TPDNGAPQGAGESDSQSGNSASPSPAETKEKPAGSNLIRLASALDYILKQSKQPAPAPPHVAGPSAALSPQTTSTSQTTSTPPAETTPSARGSHGLRLNKTVKLASDDETAAARQQSLPPNGSGMTSNLRSIVRGVNIGGFLVPEFWITPSLIAEIPQPKPGDYLELCKRLGREKTLSLMKKHWETWVTEQEVERLAAAGLTHLRVPLGHWEFVETGEGYVGGTLPYFRRLVYWAHKHGLRVVPDIHTAPGSQNGFDNSGATGNINWTKDPRNVDFSKRALIGLLKYIASDSTMLQTIDAIDLLNEPFIEHLDFKQLWDYYTGGHTLVSTRLRKSPPVISIIDRGFRNYTWWHERWPRDWNFQHVDAWLDAHLYHVFDQKMNSWSLERHLRHVCTSGRDLASNSTFFPVVVGEWSLALPKAAFQGRENEARRRFAEAQLDAYEKGGVGWFFWCFKTEESPEWSFLDALDRSWLPQPLTSREFPS
ncbi:hypothetical protein GGI12_005779, partial [Dipsacomyces acuminosporus]